MKVSLDIDKNKRACRKLRLLTLTEVFINQKSVNVLEHTVKMVLLLLYKAYDKEK